MSETPKRRQRATALVLRNSRILLVKEAGVPHFSFPGGGMHRGETASAAAAREVWEELGLKARKVERLADCDHAGFMNDHRVCLMQADGDPWLAGHELDAFLWWDLKEKIPLHPHVPAILSKLKTLGKIQY